MIETGEVHCSVISGLYDGLHFSTPSIYTRIHLRLVTTSMLTNGMVFEYQAEVNPFPGSFCHQFLEIDDSGIHLYKPCQPNLQPQKL